jgi:alpha-L-fucosidase
MEQKQRMKWFEEARFGMFIHWGLYAIPARGEWVRSHERISVEDYQQYFDEFDPVDYDPVEWARIAKDAGMKYVVMTAKHHDGFCLFDSALTEYKATNTPAGRDLMKEYVEAFRAEGLKVGFYYSLIDWHHPDYPHYGDKIHPMRENVKFKGKKQKFERYREYLHGQVRELLTNYGKIDMIWFDFSYDKMSGEKWHAKKLVKMVRELQPHIIMDDRLIAGHFKPQGIGLGDYSTPEQQIPQSGVTDVKGKPIPWEACMTLNNHWGYHANDDEYKSAQQVVRGLVECVSKGGNMLMNVGPDARGAIPEASIEILEEVGDWMFENGKSIYSCGPAKLDKPEWGRYTQKGNKLYAHLFDRGIGGLAVQGLKKREIKKARLIADGSEVRTNRPWYLDSYQGMEFIQMRNGPLVDDFDTVVELTLEG